MVLRIFEVRFARFICVGFFNTTLDFLLLNLLAFVAHIPVLVANVVSVCVGVVVSYYLNHIFVFRHHSPPSLQSFAKFFIVTGISVVVVQTVVIAIMTPIYMNLLHSLLNLVSSFGLDGYEHQLAVNMAKVTAVLVGMFWNYILYSKTVFRENTKHRVVE
ncbi:MAG: GtrA family protein [Candidatus Nomurabacteria bacterium]|nr:MAG: GtrA family protein [Candidatus Nomurabacteria bacterium]